MIPEERADLRAVDSVMIVTHPIFGTHSLERIKRDWADRDNLYADRVEMVHTLLTEGTILNRQGVPLTGSTLQRVRDRALGTYAAMPPPRTLAEPRGGSEGERRWLIRRAWPWDTIPMFSGPQKVGKTTVVAAELVPALVVPGRRFLDYFEPADLPEEDLSRGVWLINAETNKDDLEAVLDRGLASDPERRALVVVDHLADLGGPESFDLTNPVNYAWWAHRLIECSLCEGEDDWAPIALIVDGVTAILQAAGKSVEHTGLWYAAFKRLMREVDTPNALAVGHSTMASTHLMGGVEALGGPDGLWLLASDYADDPTSTRRFSVQPRLGGAVVPRTVVRLDSDGRLRMEGGTPSSSVPETPPEEADEDGGIVVDLSAPEPTPDDLVLAFLRGRNAEGDLPSKRETRDGVPSLPHTETDSAVARLVSAGRIEIRVRQKRGGGHAYWVVE